MTTKAIEAGARPKKIKASETVFYDHAGEVHIDKSIEAGARAIRNVRILCTRFIQLTDDLENEPVLPRDRLYADKAISAAIASGELVPANTEKPVPDFNAPHNSGERDPSVTPDCSGTGALIASAVAAERERCAQICDERAAKLRAKAKSMKQPHSQQYFGQAIEARVIADSIRALEPAKKETS